MIPAALACATAFLSLVKVLVEKFVPDKVTKKRDFHMKRKLINRLTTIQEIAEAGKKKGIVQ